MSDSAENRINDRVKKYIETGGVACINPDCKSEDIEGGFVGIDQHEASQDIVCNECGWTWTDVYKLTAVRNIDKQDDD